jgi:MoaA/NifB/PqqE/SkfB family radical SAM enzyme
MPMWTREAALAMSLGRKALLAMPPSVRRALGPDFFADLAPEFLWFEATAACRHRCKFCGYGDRVPTGRVLSPGQLERTLGDPVFRTLRLVVVSGGEPTLRPDLDAILASVHRAVPNARIVLSSSAALPERLVHAARAALALGVRLDVGVSVDGIGARHDELRGTPGLFGRVDTALRELRELKREAGARLRVSVGMVICDDTVEQVDDVRRYAKKLGAAFNPQWYNQAAYYGNVGRDRLAARAVLSKLGKTLEPTILTERALRALDGRAPKARCTMMFNACLLKSSGDMVPCFAFWESTVGNVLEASPSTIWASRRAREARKRVMDCDGCLNACGVVWSADADYLGRCRFYLRHPRVLVEKLREHLAGA